MSDYDGIAPLYHQRRLNLIVADYRGYGRSDGTPSLKDLVQDSQVILREVEEELSRRNFSGDLWIMGRSLGSIPAIELAYRSQGSLKGLIIESGFVSVIRIMVHLGIPARGRDLETIDRECLEMIQKISLPTLVIHGEKDMLVPVREAKDIFEHLGTDKKELLIIPSANHNDIMLVGLRKYFDAIQQFVESIGGRKSA